MDDTTDQAPVIDPRYPLSVVWQQRPKPLEQLFTQLNALKSKLLLPPSLNHIRAAQGILSMGPDLNSMAFHISTY